MTQTLIPRSAWGARYSDGVGPRPLPISEWWLHHSVTIAPDLLPPFTDDDAAIRTLENIGQARFGRGISYTFPVTPVGRIYVGHSMPRVGSHTLGHNTVGAAFVLVGDYTKRPPSNAQRDAIAQRMVIEHAAGRANRHTLNGGHRDASGNSTDCPGDAAEDAIPDINARAQAFWAAVHTGEIMADQQTAAELFTAYPILRNPADPDGARVAPSYVIELAAKLGLSNAAKIDALTKAVNDLAAAVKAATAGP